ncbi:hypothetical protein T05_4568 [Trichinella murrelli]|uniref:Uncharacterized protein n=1 Tax=Trichinella murrelli TaxID=144512 RepID=A0A0V0U393_9BILA|nr:hypothetical protein T05_4568 [Trichinella murrelli]
MSFLAREQVVCACGVENFKVDCSCSYTVLCGNEFLRLIVRRMNVCGVNFSSNRNHSNLHSVEQCFQRWGATKSETGSSVLFMSVKGLLESSDSGEDGLEEIASHWRSETHQFNRIDRKLSKARAVSKLRLNALNPFLVDVRVTGTAFKHNIKQISEHEQLTTLNNVDYRISNVSNNDAPKAKSKSN